VALEVGDVLDGIPSCREIVIACPAQLLDEFLRLALKAFCSASLRIAPRPATHLLIALLGLFDVGHLEQTYRRPGSSRLMSTPLSEAKRP